VLKGSTSRVEALQFGSFVSRRTAVAIAVLSVVAASGDRHAGASPNAPLKNARIVESAPPRPLVPEVTSKTEERLRPSEGWATSLEAVDVRMRNTGARAKIRLYADDGTLDPKAAHEFMNVAASVKGATEPLPTRLVQLVFRAAYKFGGANVTIVSATRKGAHGKHGSGQAIDFALDGVSASALAAYLRQTPRAGIGIYTHPKTQYVHLDVREHSYHWLDGSPPGVTWREKLLPDPNQAKRDASYTPARDLPESRSE
jgi:hypothetical protein